MLLSRMLSVTNWEYFLSMSLKLKGTRNLWSPKDVPFPEFLSPCVKCLQNIKHQHEKNDIFESTFVYTCMWSTPLEPFLKTQKSSGMLRVMSLV